MDTRSLTEALIILGKYDGGDYVKIGDAWLLVQVDPNDLSVPDAERLVELGFYAPVTDRGMPCVIYDV